MTLKGWANIGALILGLLSSPLALNAAKASQPLIHWAAIPFVFLGGALGVLFVLGIQIIRSDPKYGRLGLRVSVPLSVLLLGTGLGALGMSGVSGELRPSSLLFLAIGLGLSVGVALSSLWFRVRFNSEL